MRYRCCRRFVAYWWFVGWDCLSFGIHLCLDGPHMEIHLPFGFLRIGWKSGYYGDPGQCYHETRWGKVFRGLGLVDTGCELQMPRRQ